MNPSEAMMPKILIVDDRVENLIALEKCLNELDAKMIRATSGNTALKLSLEHDFALAIVDVQMPEMDGYELVELWRGNPVTRNMPVIFVSAIYSETYHHVKGYEAGGIDFLTKPYTPEILVSKVRIFLDLYRQRMALQELVNQLESRNRMLENMEKSLHESCNKLEDRVKERTLSLKESEERFRALAENTSDIIIRFDDKCTHLYVNPAINGTLTASSPKDIIGKTHRELGFPENLSLFWEIALSEVFEHGKPVHKLFEFDQKVYDCRLNPEFTSDRKVATVISTVRDITELKRADDLRIKLESQLRQAQKMEAIGTLAGGIAHDFNNILFPIIGYAEMIKEEVPVDHRIYHDVVGILKSANRAKDLVRQILTFSRQSDLEVRALNVLPIIKEAMKLLRSTFPTTIDIRQHFPKQCGQILADPTQVHQILMNLCTNAYHAMENNGGILEVSLTETEMDAESTKSLGIAAGNYLCLTVSDTGHGMSPAILERIFDPYFTTKEKNKGTGLGLSMVHGIVKSMGGAISVTSEVGKGSGFHIYFRRSAPDLRNKQTVHPSYFVPTGNESILLIDDEETIIQMLSRMLEGLGYRVTALTSSQEALELFRESSENFDLVITDMTMPQMTGLQLSSKLLEFRSDIPIIICTGFSEAITQEKVKALGIREFVMKPVIRKELAEAIRRTMDSKALAQKNTTDRK